MCYERVLDESLLPAYERLKSGLLRLIDEGKISREDAARVLPELRESEDEKIRKYLIDELNAAKSVGELKYIIPQPTREECIAYLEKQKDQKHYWKPTETDVALFNKAVTTNKALTPTERAQLDIIRSKFGYCRAVTCSGIVQEEQKPAEWSEEDERVYDILLNEFKQLYDGRSTSLSRKEVVDVYNFVKSLRPSWKPSEEQMDALKELIDDANRAGWVTPGATELYEQLKKL